MKHGRVGSGDVVAYVLSGGPLDGQIRAAVVSVVHVPAIDHPDYPGACNVDVVLEGEEDDVYGAHYGSVLYDEQHRPNTWHWPRRH
jgi:hypothetical protein